MQFMWIRQPEGRRIGRYIGSPCGLLEQTVYVLAVARRHARHEMECLGFESMQIRRV